ncbi:MAG: YfhO family protein [Candidatus Latescibacterota bacterium]|nr:YfhO family protein [Candidatus Latescibacterota bacterium]
MSRPSRADAVSLSFLLLAVAVFFRNAIAGGAFFVQDVMVQNYPFRHLYHDALAAGCLPLWTPHINCGFPLFAEGQAGALYPLNLLLGVVADPVAAITWIVVGHLALAGVLMYGFLRSLQAHPAAALTSAMVYSLGGYIVVRAMSTNFVTSYAWTPLLLLLVEANCGLPKRRFWLIAPIVALQLLGGHPQAAVYSAMAVGGYAVLRGIQMRSLQLPMQTIAALALGVGIAAVQLAPTFELAQHSLRARGVGYQQFVNMSLPPERLISLFLPDYFGNSASGTYWGQAEGFFIQLCPYLGSAAIPLIAIAVIEARTAAGSCLAMIAVIGLVLSLGEYTGLFDVLYQVPLLRQFRIPTRFLLWWALGGAALCGLGVHRLLDANPLGRPWWLACLVAGGATAVVVFCALQGDAVALPGWWSIYRSDLLVGFGWLAAALTLLSVLSLPSVRHRLAYRGVVCVSIPLLMFGDLHAFGSTFNGVIPAQVYTHTPETAKAIFADDEIRSHGEPGEMPIASRVRVASFVTESSSSYNWHQGWRNDTAAYRAYPQTLRMYTGALYGLPNTLPGWSPLHMERHSQLARFQPGLLAQTGTNYIISHRSVTSGAVEQIAAEPEYVYHHAPALPRAYTVPNAVIVPEAGERLRRMSRRDHNPRQMVVLESDPGVPLTGSRAFAPARIVEYSDTRVVIELDDRQAGEGFLVLLDTYYPGWTATVDGMPTEILAANHVFRAVAVDEGNRQVAFDYTSNLLMLGTAVSLLTLAIWLVVMYHGGRFRPMASGKSRDPNFASWAIQGALIVILYGFARHPELWLELANRADVVQVLGG